MTNYPQGGIFAGGRAPAGKYDVVRNCTLHGNVAITNGFALNAGARIKLLHNTITGSTRGIAVMDGGNTDCEIAGNSVIVREYPNREYGNTGTTVRAFEMRSYKVLGTLTDINIHDNHFEAISDETTFHGASGARIVQVIEGSRNIRFANNFIKATVARTVSDDGYNWAHAMDINTSRSDDELTVSGNTFESNDIGVGLGGYGAVGEADPFKNILFLHNTFKKSTDGVQDRKFYPYEIGFYNQPYTNVKLIGSSFPDNVTDGIHWLGGGVIDNVSTGWPVSVKVAAGSAKCSDAVVELYDTKGMLLTKRVADGQGVLRDLPAPMKKYTKPLHGAVSTTDLTPLTLRVCWDGREKKQQITPDKEATIDIALSPGNINTTGGGKVAAPTFTPLAGNFASKPTVTISTTTKGASIRYTTDGMAPTPTSGTLINGESGTALVSASCTLKAIAYKENMITSPVTSGNFTVPVHVR